MFYGQISNPPTTLWMMENWMFQLPLISFLSTKYSTVSVFGYWHLSLILLATTLWIHLLFRILSPLIHNTILKTILVLCLVIGIAGSSIVHVYYVRDAILIGASCMFLYYTYYSPNSSKHLLLLIPFFYACTIRVSVVLLVVGLISITVLAHTQQLRKTIDLFKYFWMISFSIFLIAECYRGFTSNPAMKMEARIEYAIYDREALIQDTTMKTKSDSLRYTALSNYFLIMDSSKLSLPFITKFIDGSKYGNFWISKDDIQHFIHKSGSIILEHKTSIIAFYLFLFLMLFASSRSTLFTLVTFNITAWLIVFLIGCKFRVNPYFFDPWLAVIFGGNLFLFTINTPSISMFHKTIFVTLAGILALTKLAQMNNTAIEQKQYNASAYIYLEKIDTLTQHQIPLLWTSDESYLPTDLFARKKTEVLKKCLFMNWSYFFYFEWTRERFIHRLGFSPLDWAQMTKCLVNQKNKVCFVMPLPFSRFLTSYFNVMYHTNIYFDQEQPAKEITPYNFVFNIKNQSVNTRLND